MELNFKIINWNIGGAKYLEFKKVGTVTKKDFQSESIVSELLEKNIIKEHKTCSRYVCFVEDIRDVEKLRKSLEQVDINKRELICGICRQAVKDSRETFRSNLNKSIEHVIHMHKPHIITLQEITEYSEKGDYKKPENIIDIPIDYKYFHTILIDTRRHSHQGKWNKVRDKGGWPDNAHFGQGNAFLVHKDISMFPVWSLPSVNTSYKDWLETLSESAFYDIASKSLVEEVILELGLYFGDRNTEPRCASVMHLVINDNFLEGSMKLEKPLDIFILNTHLTTLMLEREGIPEIDVQASNIRIKQLDIIFEGIISRYNKWRKEGFLIRGKTVNPKKAETHKRHSPIWILAGDFNFTPESEEYRYVKNRNFKDLIKNHGLGTKTSGLGNDPTLTVDYIFAGPLFEAIDPHYTDLNIDINKVEVDDLTRISDHFPIFATLPINLPEN